ncbi:protein FAM161B isoform X2 [Electrophorus electricus]|uniref:protein FAM161B isoform X2 n=1 Tax=Electrophorus electricus TaxID=8005 RepID=UPI0015D0A8AA|nr:protein FAM161B isoform X2 [Electrophorus electricus]
MMEMSETVQSFLEDGQRPEASLELRLASLKAAHQQQLQQVQLEHQADLEGRILQDSLLSSHTGSPVKTHGPLANTRGDRNSSKNRGHIYMFNKPKRSSSTPDLSSKMSREKTPMPGRAWTSGTAPNVAQGMMRTAHLQDIPLDKEEMAWAECQKQFRAAPVPKHIFRARYDDMVREWERARHEARQQRTEFLLTMQRPFTFHQREERERGRPRQGSGPEQHREGRKHAAARRPTLKEVTDPAISEHLKEAEQQRKLRIQARAQETLRASSAPIQNLFHRADCPTRTAQRTKSKVLGFLEQKPSFRPKINAEVPDFDKLYQAFQSKLQERAEQREITLCQPFQLRTSALQPRQSKSRPDEQLTYTCKSSLKKSHSFCGLTSLSMDTLPTYITDAARSRSMAIRKSLELRDSKEQENAQWMKRHRMNAEAISRAVLARSKAMDPHKSLKEVYQEKLKQHRQADRERVKDYKRELREMRARVTTRPYLFEQVSQKNAKSDVERIYRNTLAQAGLDEDFVRSKGENDENHRSNHKDADSDSDDHSSKMGTQQSRVGSWEDSGHSEEGAEDSAEPLAKTSADRQRGIGTRSQHAWRPRRGARRGQAQEHWHIPASRISSTVQAC